MFGTPAPPVFPDAVHRHGGPPREALDFPCLPDGHAGGEDAGVLEAALVRPREVELLDRTRHSKVLGQSTTDVVIDQ